MKRIWRRYAGANRMLAATLITAVVIAGVATFNVGYAIGPAVPRERTATERRERQTTTRRVTSTEPRRTVSTARPPAAPQKPPASSPAVPSHPWALRELYVNPVTDAANQARLWAASRPSDAAVMSTIAAQPQAVWYGDWNANLQQEVDAYVSQAAAAQRMPVLVAYNIPQRDCSQYSAGGAAAASDYAAWIQRMALGIGGRPAVVILEPDALPMLATCLDAAGQRARLAMIKDAARALKSSPATYVYIDAGNPGFQSAATMAPRLKQADIGSADGFSLNVSNFYTTAELVAYGDQLSSLVGGKHYVLDTSRNGNGILSGDAWCNPPGRALGAVPTTAALPSPLIDALLWIKTPGQSDGNCNGGPSAGTWWPEYALGLGRAAGW